jgi:trimethylamine:corrinoid methyltransferase-like protein
VLEEVGFKIHNDEALQILTDAGVNIDLEKKTAFIPRHTFLVQVV